MAISPLTVKLMLTAAKTIADEKNIGKVLLIILLPLFIFLMLFAAVFEFITTPSLWLDGEDYSYIVEGLEGNYTGNEDFDDNVEYDSKSFLGNLLMPCDATRITSNYGMRVHPISKKTKKHTGIDFAAAWHSNIYSVADGEVVSVKIENAFGRNITVRHQIGNNVIYSFYAHLSASHVRVGDIVTAGQVIGLEGGQPNSSDTGVGASTGHHLHFEIRTKPSYLTDLDPKKYLRGF